jgi:hypothetical protein
MFLAWVSMLSDSEASGEQLVGQPQDGKLAGRDVVLAAGESDGTSEQSVRVQNLTYDAKLRGQRKSSTLTSNPVANIVVLL